MINLNYDKINNYYKIINIEGIYIKSINDLINIQIYNFEDDEDDSDGCRVNYKYRFIIRNNNCKDKIYETEIYKKNIYDDDDDEYNEDDIDFKEFINNINTIIDKKDFFKKCNCNKIFTNDIYNNNLCNDCIKSTFINVNNDDINCSICLNSLKVNCYKLKCNHFFHKKCIKNDSITKCPICRSEL